MILRKPYAFFIKIFKPIHIFLSFLVVILIYKTNNILTNSDGCNVIPAMVNEMFAP